MPNKNIYYKSNSYDYSLILKEEIMLGLGNAYWQGNIRYRPNKIFWAVMSTA